MADRPQTLLEIAKFALNGWACYAKTERELDEIGRLHTELKALADAPVSAPQEPPYTVINTVAKVELPSAGAVSGEPPWTREQLQTLIDELSTVTVIGNDWPLRKALIALESIAASLPDARPVPAETKPKEAPNG